MGTEYGRFNCMAKGCTVVHTTLSICDLCDAFLKRSTNCVMTVLVDTVMSTTIKHLLSFDFITLFDGEMVKESVFIREAYEHFFPLCILVGKWSNSSFLPQMFPL